MGIYGKYISNDKLYTLESIEVEEVVQESLVVTAATAMGAAATCKKIFDVATFIGSIGFQVIKMYKKEDAKDKLKIIEKALKEKDPKFIPVNELSRKVYSCQRFYDNNITKEKELRGIAKIFGGFFADRAYIYSTDDNKEIFTYFSLKDVDFKPNIDLDSPDGRRIQNKILDKAEKLTGQNYEKKSVKDPSPFDKGLVGAKRNSISSKFYFKLNDKSLEKYKYYYLTVACLESGEMTKEAINWVNATYKQYENSKNSKG